MKNNLFEKKVNGSIWLSVLFLFLVSLTLTAQVPDKISYQAIVRDASQNLVKEQQIGVKISLLQGHPDGNAVYTEIQYPHTNINGLVSLEFGGAPGFELVNWADGPFFLEVSIDIEGGENYDIVATSQLLSVPYALYASSAGTLNQEFVSEEEDPVFQGSVAAEITQDNVVNWNTAFSWGDHDNLYLYQDWVPDWSQITNRPEKISDLELDAGGNVISNLAPAVAPYDAVTKEYVDFLLARIEALENFVDMAAGFDIPEVVIDTVFPTGAFTAIANAAVVNNGGADLLYSRGFVWSTTENPDMDNYEGLTHDGTQLGEYTGMLDGLMPNTTYYVRAYARNVAGTAYSEQLSFTTFDTDEVVIDIDNNLYWTVEINGKLWMAENLRVTRYNDGSDIPKLTGSNEWSSTSSGAYTIYPHESVDEIDSEEEMVLLYGLLYNWMAATDDLALCPVGWRLPSEEEWIEFELYLGMNPSVVYNSGWRGFDEGGKLKSTHTEPDPHPRWLSPNTMAQDLFGYKAVPAGFRSHTGNYSTFGENSLWWTSTTNADVSAWYRSLQFDRGTIGRFFAWNRHGFSVRCIQD